MSRLVYIEEPVSDNDAPFDEDYISDDYYALKSDFKATKRSKPTPSSKPHSSLPVKERGELKKKSSNRRERGRKGGEDDNEGDNNLVNEEEEEILASFHTAPDIQIRNGSDKRQKIVVEREDFAEDLKTKEKEKKKKKKKEKEKRSLEANNESHSVSENNAVIDLTCDSPSPESPSLSAQNVASSLASSPNIDPPSSSSSSGQESRLRKLAVSSWLKSFLAHKRDNSSIPPPFEEPSSDSILRDFAADFKGSQFDEEINTKEEIVLDDDELLLFPEDNAEEIISRESLRLKQNQDLLNAEEEKTSSVTLNLFNLPYSATEMTLRNLLEPLGVTLQSVIIKMDKKKNLPAGSASITVVCEAEQVETLIGMIKEQELSGRKLRVEEGNGVSRRGTRTSEGGMGRYFGGVDMSCKCFDCGEVGHKASDCPNETLPVPCGLCAGLDHDSRNTMSL